MNRLQRLQTRITARQLGCKREFHGGADYGGWTVCAEHLSAQTVVYSFGVGEDISFDLSLIAKYHLNVFAFDPTPRSIAWIKTQTLPPEFHLVEYGIAAFDGTATFFPPDNPDHISHTMLQKSTTADRALDLPVRRLTTLMPMLGHSSIDLLKMDVEGAEYDVLDDLLASSILPPQLLVEFHDRFEGVGASKTEQAIHKLQDAGYKLFSRSLNNTEYSFLRGE